MQNLLPYNAYCVLFGPHQFRGLNGSKMAANPTAPRNDSEKLYHRMKYIRDTNTVMPKRVKAKLTDTILEELSKSLADNTVFEIVRQLEDIQQLKERRLHHRRREILKSQEQQKADVISKQRQQLANCPPLEKKRLSHRLKEERDEVDVKFQKELRTMDEEIIEELDSIVKEQQITLFQAAVPFFSETEDTEKIEFQIQLLDMIRKVMNYTSTA